MFLLTTTHMTLLLYECFTGTVPPRVLQAAVAVAQFQVRGNMTIYAATSVFTGLL